MNNAIGIQAPGAGCLKASCQHLGKIEDMKKSEEKLWSQMPHIGLLEIEETGEGCKERGNSESESICCVSGCFYQGQRRKAEVMKMWDGKSLYFCCVDTHKWLWELSEWARLKYSLRSAEKGVTEVVLQGLQSRGGEGHWCSCVPVPTWPIRGLGLLHGGPRDPDVF